MLLPITWTSFDRDKSHRRENTKRYMHQTIHSLFSIANKLWSVRKTRAHCYADDSISRLGGSVRGLTTTHTERKRRKKKKEKREEKVTKLGRLPLGFSYSFSSFLPFAFTAPYFFLSLSTLFFRPFAYFHLGIHARNMESVFQRIDRSSCRRYSAHYIYYRYKKSK